jgi:hypothetical protein
VKRLTAPLVTLLLIWVLLALAMPVPGHAKIQSKEVSVAVLPGQWTAARIKNLPKNAVVSVDVDGDGEISVALVDQADYRKYPEAHHPLYQGKVQKTHFFTVKIPAAGNYYLVLDNRAGTQKTTLDIFIQGAVGREAALLQNERFQQQARVTEKKLGKVVAGLNSLFIFKPFPIRMRLCGKNRSAFSGPMDVLICLEFARLVQKIMGNKEKASNVLLFTIFHEVGHILLRQWGYPFYNNEEVADEFATVLIWMLGQKDRLAAVPEYFIARPSLSELLAKSLKSDRHPLSIQRARNILGWMKDPQLIKRWQTIFVPHIQTAVLEKLLRKPPSWANRAMMEKELAARSQHQRH